MRIIDFQLHEPAPFDDWQNESDTVRRRVLTDLLMQSLDDLGVDAAVLYPLEDAVWATSLARDYPGRFAVVTTIGHNTDQLGVSISSPSLEHDIASARARGVVGLRLSLAAPFVSDEDVLRFSEGEFDEALGFMEKHRLPLFVFCSGRLPTLERPAAKFPHLLIVADHIGLAQPPYQTLEADPWAALDDLIRLSTFPNIAVKLCGAMSLSAEPYPFADIWPHLRRLIDAFGTDRIAWASDIQRFRGRIGWQIRHPAGQGVYEGKHSYRESLSFILDSPHLSDREKEDLLGGTAARMLNWP